MDQHADDNSTRRRRRSALQAEGGISASSPAQPANAGRGAKRSRASLPPKSARERAMDLIARRDHSERELVQKLTRAQHAAEEIDATLAELRERGWLPDPKILAEREADRLRRRGKSEAQIQAWLIKKGLPAAQRQSEAELETGLRTLRSSWPKLVRQAQRDLDRASAGLAKRRSRDRHHADLEEFDEDLLNLQAALKQRCLKWMAGRGFSGATARAVFTRLLEENPLK